VKEVERLEFELFNADYVKLLTIGDPETEAHFALYFGRFVSLKTRSRRLAPDIADDVRQETLCRVLLKLRQGRGVSAPERFGAFVNSVCNNVILEVSRRRAREVSPTTLATAPADARIDMDDWLISGERKELVQQVLKELAEKDADILREVFYENLDRKEICRKFKVKEDHLRQLLHRAKAKFEIAYRRRQQTDRVCAPSASS
jgi:RNA polymerase sigma factor (sigma-70 family)